MSTKSAVDPEAWERHPGESAKAFEAFCIYRDMGVDRSVRKVADRLGKSNTLISRWSVRNNWVERVSAWDSEQDRLNRIKQQKDIAKMRKNHANIASAMLVKAAQAIKDLDPKDIKPSDIPKIVDSAAKLERISRGDVGEVVEERDGGSAEQAVTFYIPENNR